MADYFLDTYALLEITKRNPAFGKFASSSRCSTGELNLVELYYVSLREFGEAAAENDYELFSKIVERHSAETVKRAMRLRLKLKREKKLAVSYADALGYQLALEKGLRFVTGDKAFQAIENVEFVK